MSAVLTVGDSASNRAGCLAVLVMASLLLSVPIHAETLKDAEQWYRTSYAVLWSDSPADHIDAILRHYAPTIVTHAEAGELRTDSRDAWLKAPMSEWLADGWQSAELIHLDTTVINESTATFMARWRDVYVDGMTEESCGWYLADRIDEQWMITAYADSVCDDAS
jgi:hypothetical protein